MRISSTSALLELDEFRRGLDLVRARMRQVHIDFGLDAAGTRTHDDDAAAEEDRFLDVVGHEQHRLLVALPDPEQHFLHQGAGLVVQCAEGLVEQEDLRIIGERTCDGRALLHAAGELLWPMVLEARQSDLADEGIGDLVPLVLRHAALAQAEGNVFAHRQPWEQRVGLEHHAAIGARPRHLAPVERDASAGRAVEAGDDAQQRGLAATGGTEDGDEVVVADDEVGRFQRPGRCVAVARGEGARDLFDLQGRHASFQGNSQALNALNRKSEISPISPITMMPKMIWPVLSSAWLSVII
ncbi:hypothetical protein ACVIVD_003167 [Bradyrhizobium liaoningense]